jgi:hypothetical protein
MLQPLLFSYGRLKRHLVDRLIFHLAQYSAADPDP